MTAGAGLVDLLQDGGFIGGGQGWRILRDGMQKGGGPETGNQNRGEYRLFHAKHPLRRDSSNLAWAG
jgi:hypothetical protein